jgi:hypothetical protein
MKHHMSSLICRIALTTMATSVVAVAAAPGNGNSAASDDKPKIPPASDILTWVASNSPSRPNSYWIQEISFQGCTVSQILRRSPPGDTRPISKMGYNKTDVDLTKLSPDSLSIKADGGLQFVTVHSDLGFNTHTVDHILSVEAIERHQSEPDQLVEDDSASKDFPLIWLQDAAMSERIEHALHDAIVGCGGKAVAKDLY